MADYRDPTGKRRWETYDTRKEAEAALAQATVAIRTNRYVSPKGLHNKSGRPLRATTRAYYATTRGCTGAALGDAEAA